MEDTNSLIEQRRTKLAALAAKGINPFPKQIRFVTWTLTFSRCH